MRNDKGRSVVSVCGVRHLSSRPADLGEKVKGQQVHQLIPSLPPFLPTCLACLASPHPAHHSPCILSKLSLPTYLPRWQGQLHDTLLVQLLLTLYKSEIYSYIYVFCLVSLTWRNSTSSCISHPIVLVNEIQL